MGLGTLYLSRGEDITYHISRTGISGPFVTGTLLLVAGMMLREGKKYSVLFLRPFNSIANEKAMKAFSRKLGSRFTVIALDDGSIPPPSRSVIRLLVALLLLAPASLVLFFVGALVMPTSGGEFRSHAPAILAISAGIFLVRTTWRGITQPQERPVVDSPRSLRRAVLVSRAQSTWGLRMLIRRVVIVKTTDDMWQAAVSGVGNVADIGIIDVSLYSSSIEWELRFLRQSKPTSSLVISSQDAPRQVEVWQSAEPIEFYATSASADKDFERRLRERLTRML
jgi:hypothetical protein